MTDKKDTGFPRMLYTKGGPHKWMNKIEYGYVIVNNSVEYDAALEGGYKDKFDHIMSDNVLLPDDDDKKTVTPEDDEPLVGLGKV